MPRQRKCGCDPSRNGDKVFLGPGEGPSHKALVVQARQSWLQLRPPDVAIRCSHDSRKKQYVMKSDLCRESTLFKKYFHQNPSSHEITLDCSARVPHLSKLADFLFTGDYAVTEHDVMNYGADMKDPKSRCNMCRNHYRLLSLHLGMFMTGRTLEMELLQLLAMDKVAEAAETAGGDVLHNIVADLYSLWPSEDQFGNRFGIAGFDDFRPVMIIPAVVGYLQRHRGPVEWLRAFEFGGASLMVSAQQKVHRPEEEFRELREWSPEFDEDLTMGLRVARLGYL